MQQKKSGKSRFAGRLKRLLCQKQGSSMVSVVVAFVILLLLVALFTGVVKLSANLLAKADSLRAAQTTLEGAYLLQDPALAGEALAPAGTQFVFTDGDSSFVWKAGLTLYSTPDARLYVFETEE